MIAARHAVYERLAAIADLPEMVFPGQEAEGVTPRIEVNPGPSRNMTMGWSEVTDHAGEIQVIVVTSPRDVPANNAAVEAIVAAFPVHLRFDGVAIPRLPDVRPPLVEAAEYRVAIFIRYQTLL